MSREAIDQMWQKAMRQSIEDNEMFTRYHFDALVRADEREACAKLCEELRFSALGPSKDAKFQRDLCAKAIRARGETK
jgi:hypothetical protein